MVRRTWFNIAMDIGLDLAALSNLVFRFHQRSLLLAFFFVLGALATARRAIILVLAAHLHPLGRRGAVVVHGPEGLADTEEEHHEAFLGELGVVDEVGIDHVLEVAAAVIRQQDVYCFCGLVGAALGRNGMVKGRDDVGDVREEPVGVDFAHRLLDGLGAKRAADLLEGKHFAGRCVFDEVDVREAALLVRG